MRAIAQGSYSGKMDTPSEHHWVYVLDEVYESEAAVANHWKLGSETWKDFGAFVAWASNVQVTAQHRGEVFNSLG